jgi:hypothetical protein
VLSHEADTSAGTDFMVAVARRLVVAAMVEAARFMQVWHHSRCPATHTLKLRVL